MAPLTLELSEGHGAVLLVAAATAIVHIFFAEVVMFARKKYNVQFPLLYAPESHKNNKEFNCVQRAHQNFLENISFFFAFLLTSGLAYPWTSTVLGVIFLLGRIVYFLGYSTGSPAARNYGAFWTIGLLGLMIGTIMFGLRVLGVISA
ncbi:unnamed protein product [Closterium sp. Naga37s-1]|nr:unnamed protein product [Closterium sp. Naga37s-1]